MRSSMLVVVLALGFAAAMPAQETRFLEMKTILGAPVRKARTDAARPVEANADRGSPAGTMGLESEIGIVSGIRLAGDRTRDGTEPGRAPGAPVDLVVQVFREQADTERLAIPLAKAHWQPEGAYFTVSLDDAHELPAVMSRQDRPNASQPNEAQPNAKPPQEPSNAGNQPPAPGQEGALPRERPSTLTADRLASAMVETRDGLTPPVDGLIFDLRAGTLAYVLAEGTEKDITPSTPQVRIEKGRILFGDRDAVIPWDRVEARTTGPGGPVLLVLPIDSTRLAEAPKMSLARSGKLQHEGFRQRVESFWQQADKKPSSDRPERQGNDGDGGK